MKPGRVLIKLCTFRDLSRNGAMDSSGTMNLSIKTFCIVFSFRILLQLIADADDFANQGAIPGGFDHEMGDVGARDLETERGQVADSNAILSREWLVCQLRRAHDGPVDIAFGEGALHGGGIGNHSGKQQAAKNICRWHDRILEKECD